MSNIKFHEVSVIGSPILDLKRFYDYYDELKKERDKWPFYLYSFNSVDTFSLTVQKNKTLKIINNYTSEDSIFFIENYIDDHIIKLNNLFKFISVKKDDLEISIDKSLITINVPANSNKAFELSKKHFIEKLRLHIAPFVKFVRTIKLAFELNLEDFLISLEMIDQVQNFFKDFYSKDKLVGDFLYDVLKQEIENNLEISKEKYIENLYFAIIKLLDSNYNTNFYNKSKEYLFLTKEYSNQRIVIDFFDELKEFIKLDLSFNNRTEITNNKIKLAEKHILDIIGRKENEKYFSNPRINWIVLENFYIGQAFGENGDRNALDRIGKGHDKTGRIQSEINNYVGKKELAIILFRIEPKNLLLIEDFGTNLKKDINFLLNNKIDAKSIVDLTELALITYFKPKYNVQHVRDNFKKVKSSKIKEIIKNNDGIVVNMAFEGVNWIIKSSSLQGVGKDFSSNYNKIIQYRFNNKKLIKSSKIENIEDIFMKESQTRDTDQDNSGI